MSATYTAATIAEARRRWADGEFGAEWGPYRRLAAERGFIYPPEGSRHDSIDDAEPTQRAIVWRAIEDTPELLRLAIGQSRSWSGVVAILMRETNGRRELADLAEREAEFDRERRPTRREATERLGDVLARLR